MITVRGVELRAGARLLLSDISFTVSPGDRIGLVGRNGAGKTTLMTALAGKVRPAVGTITRTGGVGFLAQDSRAADPAVTVTDRILSARGLDRALHRLRTAEAAMAGADGPAALERAMNAYARAEAAFQIGGGYAAAAEAARVAAGLGLPERVLGEPVGALSGGQRRRVELARILFAGPDHTLLLDEPTNHLDADSVAWLRTFLQGHTGGLVVISHDTALLADVVNRVFHLDATRASIDPHNTGWSGYLAQRAADERRRARERAGAERKAAALHAQAEGVDLAVDRGSRLVVLGLNGAGKTTLLRLLAGQERPDSGRVVHGHGLLLGYFAQEHDTLAPERTVRQNLAAAAPHLSDGEVRRVLGAFLFSGDDADKRADVLSGGEKTRLALAGLVHSGANVLLLDEPTNNLDPASRDEVLAAVGSYPGAIVMVTHDEDAIDALRPDRVLLLPDADEDLWSEDYRDLAALA
ncbi:ABC-F family ATP-binding cassette domain-containing protein [Streptomyces sp. NPDC003027]